MSSRPVSLSSSRMRDFRAYGTASSDHTLCVAPRDIFPDYEDVMALLRSQSTYDDDDDNNNHDDVPFAKIEGTSQSGTREDEFESPLDVPSSPGTTFTPSTVYDDEEYIDMPAVVPRTAARQRASSRRHCQTRNRSSPYEGAGRSKPGRKKVDDDLSDDSDSPLRCTYSNPHWENGQRCAKINKSPNEAARHWRSCHEYKEAKAMLTGAMPVKDGTAIMSKAQLDAIRPLIECQNCGAFITRSDAMARHRRTNCVS